MARRLSCRHPKNILIYTMKKTFTLLFGATISLSFGHLFAQDYSEVDRILGADGEHLDRFGQSISIDGTTCVVGAFLNDYDEDGETYVDDAGAAFIYSWNPGGDWTFDQKVVPTDRDENYEYGKSVSISGDYLLVGSPRNNNDTVFIGLHYGAAYFYEKDEVGEWNLARRVFASDTDANDKFGEAVSISGNYAIIGAPHEGPSDIGKAYVFERGEDGIWDEVQTLVPTNYLIEAEFGNAVSISGDRIAVGAFHESDGESDYYQRGAVYMYERDEFGVWNEVQHLTASDYLDGIGEAAFGHSVSLSGDDLIVGAPEEDYNAAGGSHKTSAGAAYIFERDEDGTWVEIEKIVASDRNNLDEFGHSVAIEGGIAVIGAIDEDEDADGENNLFNSGSAYIFERDGDDWDESQKIVSETRAEFDDFGASAAISGNFIGVGASNDDPDASGVVFGSDKTGTAFIFTPCESSESSLEIEACSEYTVPSGDETYTESGTYSDTLNSYYGCDSIINIDLTILSSASSITEVVCYEYTVPSGDETYTESGVYMDTIPNAVGCDSIITIDLTINVATFSVITEVACYEYTVPSGDETYTESGVYPDTILNAVGCDSIITIELTINTFSASSIEVTACDTYMVPSGDETYTESGIYMDTLVSAVGCDSIITIDLTILEATETEITEAVCYEYTVPSGDETYTESGIYMDTIPNMVGCDSIITIDLTILEATEATITETACFEYTVPSGNETYTETGIYTDTIPNAVGCDSIITIDLTINTVNIETTVSAPTITANATSLVYQWLDCDADYAIIDGETEISYTATENGNYAVEITDGACVDTSACITIGNVSLTENGLSEHIRIYPNPGKDQFNIELGELTDVTIRIYTGSGQLVYRESNITTPVYTFDPNLTTGIYHLEILSGEIKKEFRLVQL